MSKTTLLALILTITVLQIHAEHYDLPPELFAIVRERAMKCIAKTNANVDDLKALNRGDFTKNSNEIKEFLLCIGAELGVLTEEGDLDLEGLLEYEHPEWPMETVHKFYNMCKVKGKVTHGEAAFEMYQCYYEHTDNIPLIPLE